MAHRIVRSGPLALVATLLLIFVPVASGQDAQTEADVLAVIQRNNTALPAAYRDWDLNGLGEYLTGDELVQRATDIQQMIFAGNEIWFEQRSIDVTTIDFPEPNRATVETIETWYEWVNI